MYADEVLSEADRILNGEPEIDYWGGCPECRKNDGYLNVSADHWFVCHEHKTRWYIGSNLFSQWRKEDPEAWAANIALLNAYTEVDPLRPAPIEQAANTERRTEDDDLPF